MELILWRHADAEDGADDMARRLTRKGEKQAKAMAKWLRAHLPDDYTVVASPALRAQETAEALGVKIVTDKTLAPGATVDEIAKAVARHKGVVIVVGHQPDLGRAAAHFVGGRGEWSIQKGAIWWLEGPPPARVRAVLSPDLLKD